MMRECENCRANAFFIQSATESDFGLDVRRAPVVKQDNAGKRFRGITRQKKFNLDGVVFACGGHHLTGVTEEQADFV